MNSIKTKNIELQTLLIENDFERWLLINNNYDTNCIFIFNKLSKYLQVCIIIQFIFETHKLLLTVTGVNTESTDFNVYVDAIETKLITFFKTLNK